MGPDLNALIRFVPFQQLIPRNHYHLRWMRRSPLPYRFGLMLGARLIRDLIRDIWSSPTPTTLTWRGTHLWASIVTGASNNPSLLREILEQKITVITGLPPACSRETLSPRCFQRETFMAKVLKSRLTCFAHVLFLMVLINASNAAR